MPLIKLNRINKGGEIVLNSALILSIEVESKSTTVRLSDGQIFSVQESIDAIMQLVEHIESERIKNGILSSGLGVEPLTEPRPPAKPGLA
jgi:uncharacterized protein YlzI (FlbEa/FlbD family)